MQTTCFGPCTAKGMSQLKFKVRYILIYLGLLASEYEGWNVLHSIGKYLPVDRAPYCRQLEP